MSTAVGSKTVWGRARGILGVLAAAVFTTLVLVGCGGDDDGGNPGGGPGGNPSGTRGTFTDSRDGESYNKVKIGTQTWMAENLNYVTGNSVCYEGKSSNCAKYGRLYNWETARTACPAGWHLPSHAEWTTLVNYAGGTSTAGGKLKSTSGWDVNSFSDRGGSTDEYGFSALPGGRGSPVGDVARFYEVGQFGYWWTATEYNANRTYQWKMSYVSGLVFGEDDGKAGQFSVRCVQNP